MHTEPNAYSCRWFEFFHIDINEARTIQETAFIRGCVPLPDFRKVADVCCGMGRHARALSKHGYSVIGIDRDADVIAKARALAGGPTYVNADVRDYRPDPGGFDVAMIMSQSFGYFDATTNREVLGRLTDGVSRRRSSYPGSVECRVFCRSSGSVRVHGTWWSSSRNQACRGRSAVCASGLSRRWRR
jgi:SAM-dependent methyltransferase